MNRLDINTFLKYFTSKLYSKSYCYCSLELRIILGVLMKISYGKLTTVECFVMNKNSIKIKFYKEQKKREICNRKAFICLCGSNDSLHVL